MHKLRKTIPPPFIEKDKTQGISVQRALFFQHDIVRCEKRIDFAQRK